LTAIPDLLLVLDSEGRYRQIFTSNQDLLIDDAANLLGKTLADVMPPEEATPGMTTITQVIRTRQLAETEYGLWVGNERRWFSARVVPYGTEEDPCVLWVARDISELHHAQARLLANEQLLRKLLHLQEQERKLVAYEIHDGLVQYMVGAQMSLDGIRRRLQSENKEILQNIEWSRDLIGKSIDEARHLISELRPLIIDELGIIEAIRYLIDEMSGKSDIHVQFLPIIEFDRLPPLLEGNVFRIVQEALANVRHHSQASDVQIKLFQDAATLQIQIQDNGIGFDPENIEENRFGVEGIIKRAQLFGGRAEFHSSPGNGTKIDVVLPLELPTADEMTDDTMSSSVAPVEPPSPVKVPE
jgi:signal transduction histidine kinase